MRLSPDNWKLAILVGLVVSVIAAIALPASTSFWIIGAIGGILGIVTFLATRAQG